MSQMSLKIGLAIYGISEKGGAEKSVIWLANQLVAHGHTPYIVVHSFPNQATAAFPLDKGVVVDAIDRYSCRKSTFLPRLQFKVIKWLSKNLLPNSHTLWRHKYRDRIDGFRDAITANKLDIVVAYLPITFPYVAEAMKGLNIPLIIANRNDPQRDFSLSRNKSDAYDLKARFKAVEQSFSFNAVQIEPFKAFFNKQVQEKTFIIPNHVKPFKYSQNDCDNARSSPKKTILNVASLTPKKNQTLLLSAFALLASNYPDWTLVIVGGGPNEKKLKQHTKELNISKSVVFQGIQDNVDEHYKNASIFAFPSLHEGQSNALLEAMSAGLPSVAITACRSNHCLLTEGQGGICTEQTAEAFACALKQLMNDKHLREELGHNARAYASTLTEASTYLKWEKAINIATSQKSN